VMAVNDKDLEWFRSIVGKNADKMEIRKSDVVYVPPQKNIIGNAEYRYIPQKKYLSLDRDTALKMAEIMEKQSIRFSGRVSANGKTTLTISQPDFEKVSKIKDSVIAMRKQFAKDEKADEIIGNKAYRNIQSKHYFHSKMKPEEYKEIQPFLDESAEYSGLIRDGKVIFTVEKDDAHTFYQALESSHREAEIYRNLADSGLSEAHFSQLKNIIHKVAVNDVSLSLENFFDQRYSNEQFSQMKQLTENYLEQSPFERMGKDSVLSDMLKVKNDFDIGIEMADYFSEHSYSDEQKALITEMFMNNEPRSFIDAIDESFTTADIQKYNEILHDNKIASEITDFLKNHKQAEPEKSKKLYDVFIYDSESKTNQPMRCEADNEREAREIGNTYIRQWNLPDAEITDIREVQLEREKSLTMHEVGNFYEMYGKDAEIVSNILGLNITPKNGESMVGFPDFKKDDYADKLKNAGYDVEVEEVSQKAVKMTLYHGTTHDFDTFKPDYRGAIWADTDFTKAENYAGNMHESKVLTCEAELKNPAHFTFGTAENWDIDSTIHEAKSNGHDSAFIDFKFQAQDNDFYKFALEKYPDEKASKILSSISGASSDDALEGETISEFAKRMAENDNLTHSYAAVFDPELIKIVDKTSVYEKAESGLESDVKKTDNFSDIDTDQIKETPEKTAPEDADIEEDEPLFADADVIEEIEKSERAEDDKPFQNSYGEQMSLFGFDEPIQQKKTEKPKSEFAKGPVVDGVQVYNALAAEIDRGTGFVDGKLRVQDFYEEQNPSIQQLADFLKKEYGTGGHSGEGNISLVNTVKF
ncbi:MAG: hypothetical protein NC320_13825, partial [Clostridium sp.]|nr:hypothetical protein [Clostridium sp.]